MYVSAIVVAAGKGTRISAGSTEHTKPKQFIEICGKPILAHALDIFENCIEVDEIIIVTSDTEYCMANVVVKYGYKKVVSVIPGGKERQDSVRNGLRHVSLGADIVLVHDGVRPFVTEESICDVIRAAVKYGSCVLGVRVTDTIKVCAGDMKITHTPDRDRLWAVQTPQGFKYGILLKAYEQAEETGFYGTDDASLVERIGFDTYIVPGSYDNIKITNTGDLDLAERMISERRINI